MSETRASREAILKRLKDSAGRSAARARDTGKPQGRPSVDIETLVKEFSDRAVLAGAIVKRISGTKKAGDEAVGFMKELGFSSALLSAERIVATIGYQGDACCGRPSRIRPGKRSRFPSGIELCLRRRRYRGPVRHRGDRDSRPRAGRRLFPPDCTCTVCARRPPSGARHRHRYPSLLVARDRSGIVCRETGRRFREAAKRRRRPIRVSNEAARSRFCNRPQHDGGHRAHRRQGNPRSGKDADTPGRPLVDRPYPGSSPPAPLKNLFPSAGRSTDRFRNGG